MDSDVILMDDIEKMWKLFDQFGPKAVGLFLGKRGATSQRGKLKLPRFPYRCLAWFENKLSTEWILAL